MLSLQSINRQIGKTHDNRFPQLMIALIQYQYHATARDFSQNIFERILERIFERIYVTWAVAHP